MRRTSSATRKRWRKRLISALDGRAVVPVERLEGRRLLSATVTATQLNPPLTADDLDVSVRRWPQRDRHRDRHRPGDLQRQQCDRSG